MTWRVARLIVGDSLFTLAERKKREGDLPSIAVIRIFTKKASVKTPDEDCDPLC